MILKRCAAMVLGLVMAAGLSGCATGFATGFGYNDKEVLTGILEHKEWIDGRMYCYYKIDDLENNTIFSTIPSRPKRSCTPRIKINMETDEVTWLER